MARPQLHHTLTAAVEAVSPQAQSGIVVTEVDLDLPLEIVAAEQRGRLLIAGNAPHSRWVSGFLPDIHVAHIHIELADPPSRTPPRRHGG
jgi:hypothetical protein